MTLKRPRTLDCDAPVYPVEAADLLGVPVQRLLKLWMAGRLPAPVNGVYRLREIVAAYVSHVEKSARKEATAAATRAMLTGL